MTGREPISCALSFCLGVWARKVVTACWVGCGRRSGSIAAYTNWPAGLSPDVPNVFLVTAVTSFGGGMWLMRRFPRETRPHARPVTTHAWFSPSLTEQRGANRQWSGMRTYRPRSQAHL